MTSYQRTPETIFALVDKDVVALHVERGKCYGMEKVSADIWDMLAEPRSVGQLCQTLTQRYEVDPDRCKAEVEQFLGQLVEEGLITPVA